MNSFVNTPIDIDTLDRLKEIIGDDLKEVLLTFMQASPAQVLAMEQALESEEIGAIQHNAHTLQGSASALGMLGLTLYCADLEETCKHNPPDDLEVFAPAIAEIQATLQQVLVLLEDYVQKF